MIGRATTSNSKSINRRMRNQQQAAVPCHLFTASSITHRLPPPRTLRRPASPFCPLPSLAGRGPHGAPSGLIGRLVHVSLQPSTVAQRFRIRIPTHGRLGLVSARAPLPVRRLLLALALGLGAASLGCQNWASVLEVCPGQEGDD
jgi:hypothetical protein